MKGLVRIIGATSFCIAMALSIGAEDKKPFTCTKLEVTHKALLDTLRMHVKEMPDVKVFGLSVLRARYEGAIAYLSTQQSAEFIVKNEPPIGMTYNKTITYNPCRLRGVVEVGDAVVGVFSQSTLMDGLFETHGTYEANSDFSDTTDCRKRVWVFVIREDKVSLVDSYDAEDRY